MNAIIFIFMAMFQVIAAQEVLINCGATCNGPTTAALKAGCYAFDNTDVLVSCVDGSSSLATFSKGSNCKSGPGSSMNGAGTCVELGIKWQGRSLACNFLSCTPPAPPAPTEPPIVCETDIVGPSSVTPGQETKIMVTGKSSTVDLQQLELWASTAPNDWVEVERVKVSGKSASHIFTVTPKVDTQYNGHATNGETWAPDKTGVVTITVRQPSAPPPPNPPAPSPAPAPPAYLPPRPSNASKVVIGLVGGLLAIFGAFAVV